MTIHLECILPHFISITTDDKSSDISQIMGYADNYAKDTLVISNTVETSQLLNKVNDWSDIMDNMLYDPNLLY